MTFIKMPIYLFIFLHSLLITQINAGGVAGIGPTSSKDNKQNAALSKNFSDSINNVFRNNPKMKEGPSSKGKREIKDIMSGILNTLAKLRYRYNLRLKEKPDFKGKIIVRFSILSSGRVLFSETYASSFNDLIFEKEVNEIIKDISFSKFSDESDTTVVIYPFIFTR